jgi:hypothetical protein
VSFSVFNCWLLPTILLLTVELSLSEIISILKCVNNNYELFYCCSCSRPFTLHCSYFIWTAILRRDGDCCGREKLALLQLPVLVKYRIALVLVPLASDSRILSYMVEYEDGDSEELRHKSVERYIVTADTHIDQFQKLIDRGYKRKLQNKS